MTDRLSEQQWAEYERVGYLKLGRILDHWELPALQRRMDEIMLGQVSYPELTSCYMDGRTRNTLTGDQFPIVFGQPETAWPFLQSVSAENRSLRESAAEAERYARSLAEHAERLEKMRGEAEQYARSLEVELARVRAALPAPS
jgi:hypothetical protein